MANIHDAISYYGMLLVVELLPRHEGRLVKLPSVKPEYTLITEEIFKF